MLSGGFMKNADDIMEKLGFIADYSTFKEINYYNKKFITDVIIYHLMNFIKIKNAKDIGI